MKAFALTALATLLVMTGCGCAGGAEIADDVVAGGAVVPVSETEVATARGLTDLGGVRYVLTSLSGRELVQGTTLTLTVVGDRLSVTAGCNRLSFSFSVDVDGQVGVSNPTSTRMGCVEELMAQDRWLMDYLVGDELSWTVDDEQLVIEGNGVTLTMVPDTS